MKPSERRALRQAELAAKMAEEQNKSAEQTDETAVKRKRFFARKESQSSRKEGFFQANVRLITFIITAAVVIVLGPWGIDMLIASEKQTHSVTDRKDISVEEVYAVHDYASQIKWTYFDKFNYEDHSYYTNWEKYIVREYKVAGTRLVLKVGGPQKLKYPQFVQLIDYDTGDYVDVLAENPRHFVNKTEE